MATKDDSALRVGDVVKKCTNIEAKIENTTQELQASELDARTICIIGIGVHVREDPNVGFVELAGKSCLGKAIGWVETISTGSL